MGPQVIQAGKLRFVDYGLSEKGIEISRISTNEILEPPLDFHQQYDTHHTENDTKLLLFA